MAEAIVPARVNSSGRDPTVYAKLNVILLV
jgi:hypothetical protein